MSGAKFQVSAFVDSGSAGNFIHSSLVAQHQLPLVRLEKPLSVSSINGEILPEPVWFHTLPINLQIGALHQENFSFFVLPKSTSALLLGLL